jgi:hypothetical protein
MVIANLRWLGNRPGLNLLCTNHDMVAQEILVWSKNIYYIIMLFRRITCCLYKKTSYCWLMHIAHHQSSKFKISFGRRNTTNRWQVNVRDFCCVPLALNELLRRPLGRSNAWVICKGTLLAYRGTEACRFEWIRSVRTKFLLSLGVIIYYQLSITSSISSTLCICVPCIAAIDSPFQEQNMKNERKLGLSKKWWNGGDEWWM